jgi:hypothetical protein
VIRDDGEIIPGEPFPGERKVSNGAGERLHWVEPSIDSPPLRPKPHERSTVAPTPRGVYLSRQSPAGYQVDPHSEEVPGSLGDDLRQTGRVGWIVSGDHLGPTGALQEYDCLDRVGIDAIRGDGCVD